MQNPSLGQHHKTERNMFFPQKKMVCFSGEFLPKGEFFFSKWQNKNKNCRVILVAKFRVFNFF
jgi:hypothetical protein